MPKRKSTAIHPRTLSGSPTAVRTKISRHQREKALQAILQDVAREAVLARSCIVREALRRAADVNPNGSTKRMVQRIGRTWASLAPGL